MIKILTLLGTRPEIIKLSRVIAELEKHTNHILVHSGQNYDYELNEVFFNDLGIRKPDYFLNSAGNNSVETIANVIKNTDTVLGQVNPDAFLIYGDTNSSLSVIAAKRRKVPVFHMEAGNRCFDLRVPEEINRKIVDHVSDINMVISDHARHYLIREGIRPDTIIKIGSSMMEVLSYYENDILKSDILEREELNNGDYIIFSTHREENIDSEVNLAKLIDAINGITEKFGKRVIVSTHPRTRKKLESVGFNNKNRLVEFMKPFGFFEYIKLQQNAFCVISDSGTITEEASLLKFPAVTIREAHERPEGMDEGTLIMSGLDKENLLHSIDVVVRIFENDNNPFETVKDYLVSHVSYKVVKIILSYTGFVNRTVWYTKDS